MEGRPRSLGGDRGSCRCDTAITASQLYGRSPLSRSFHLRPTTLDPVLASTKAKSQLAPSAATPCTPIDRKASDVPTDTHSCRLSHMPPNARRSTHTPGGAHAPAATISARDADDDAAEEDSDERSSRNALLNGGGESAGVAMGRRRRRTRCCPAVAKAEEAAPR